MLFPFSDWSWERNFAEKKVTDMVPRNEMAAKYRGMTAGTKNIKEKTNPIVEMFDGGYLTND